MCQQHQENPPQNPEKNPQNHLPDALFDLAVNRAHRTVCQRFPKQAWPKALKIWHARTRFARRVSLETVIWALEQYPQEHPQKGASYHWKGGKHGSWHIGKALFP